MFIVFININFYRNYQMRLYYFYSAVLTSVTTITIFDIFYYIIHLHVFDAIVFETGI